MGWLAIYVMAAILPLAFAIENLRGRRLLPRLLVRTRTRQGFGHLRRGVLSYTYSLVAMRNPGAQASA